VTPDIEPTYEELEEELREVTNDRSAAILLLKDLLHPNETKEAAEERAQLFLDAVEAKLA